MHYALRSEQFGFSFKLNVEIATTLLYIHNHVLMEDKKVVKAYI